MNGFKIADVIRRINFFQDDRNWLSLNQSSVKVRGNFGNFHFGETNKDNKLHGRGIRIWYEGNIYIGYFNNGYYAPGKFINIYMSGEFEVGEIYLKDGQQRNKSTQYDTKGLASKFGY